MSTPTPTWTPSHNAVTTYAAAHPGMTYQQAEIALIKQHAESQESSAPHRISAAAFIARIPVPTWAKIQQASMSATPLGSALHRGLLQVSASTEVVANDPDLLGMLAQLVSANVITGDERTQILSF